ncbi:MAG: hypothetical protein HY553_07645 [Elusimicrobia bacterium]|nr:hypothetical protein [Elusimicrobiota bacterium]
MAIPRLRRSLVLFSALLASVLPAGAQYRNAPVPVAAVPTGGAWAAAALQPSVAPAVAPSFVARLLPPALKTALTGSTPLKAFVRRGAGAAAEELAGGVAPERAHALRMIVDTELARMRSVVGEDPELAAVAAGAAPLLDEIEGHLRAGAIDPTVELRYASKDPIVPVRDRVVRVGVYPVAADPFQWAHLLIGLQAIAKLKLDKVVFILAGDDPRKPAMTPAFIRHPMGRAVLARFAPFFAFSSIADGTLHDGETNIFRLLALNPEQKIEAFYMVGDDHYKLVDKKGNPDTLPKLEANMAKMLVDAARHKVLVAFNEREGRGEEVPTVLDVTFLPRMPFEASSTLVRGGKWSLMPFSALDHVQKTGSGLYGIPPAPGKDPK